MAVIDGEERAAQIAVLSTSPVAWAVQFLLSGTHELCKGTITSRLFFGGMTTIFGELEGVTGPQLVKREKFRVSEVQAALAHPDCTDQKSKYAVDAIVAALVAGTFDPKITVFRPFGDMIIDGNKTAAALYETNTAETIDLSVYVIRLKELAPTPGAGT